MDIGIGLLRIAQGVEGLQLSDALADGAGVVNPQGRAVLLGQMAQRGVGKRAHGADHRPDNPCCKML